MKDYGTRVAIDDFGAGYTSFGPCASSASTSLKIDGAFVQNMARSPDDRFFVRTLIDLARHLGLEIVAEWVQEEETARRSGGLGLPLPSGRPDRPRPLETPWAAPAGAAASSS